MPDIITVVDGITKTTVEREANAEEQAVLDADRQAYENGGRETLEWELIRRKRNQLLAETDHYALSDVTMTTEMSNYRQALRDLPSTTSNPDDVVFPEKP